MGVYNNCSLWGIWPKCGIVNSSKIATIIKSYVELLLEWHRHCLHIVRTHTFTASSTIPPPYLFSWRAPLLDASCTRCCLLHTVSLGWTIATTLQFTKHLLDHCSLLNCNCTTKTAQHSQTQPYSLANNVIWIYFFSLKNYLISSKIISRLRILFSIMSKMGWISNISIFYYKHY